MKSKENKSCIKDRGILHFLDKLKELEEQAKKRQEIFFVVTLNDLKKYEIQKEDC